MSLTIRRAEYYKTMVQDRPGEAYRLLTQISGADVNLLAFSAIPLDARHTELALFPEDPEKFMRAADKAGIVLTGPAYAILIHGDDRLGALADIHAALVDAKVNVYASSGVTDGRGGYGYVMYVRPEEFEAAAHALGA